MKSIFKLVCNIITVLAVIFIVFLLYCISVTKVTPFLYESYGCDLSKVENIVKTNSTSVKPIDESSYGDDYNNERIGVLGTFGDSAGFMNAFFSLLAFTAVVFTFLYQYYKDEQTDKQTRRSQFENVFFNMTSTFEEIVSHLEYIDGEEQDNLYTTDGNNGEEQYDNGNPIVTVPLGNSPNPSLSRHKKGREIFRYLYCVKLFTPETGNTASGIQELIELNSEMPLSEIKNYVFDGTLDHYFRYAYRILKYIDSCKLINNVEKLEYASIFRAQLSCYELLIMFINGIDMDNNKFKKLIEKYCLFNNLRAEMLPNTYNFYKLYEPKIDSEDGRERDGYEENAEHEYAIGAFCKPVERVSIRRLEIFQKVWEIRFSKRVEREREV